MQSFNLDPSSDAYYPCIDDGTGHVRKRLSDHPMSFVKAEAFLMNAHTYSWKKNMAYPQPINSPYFSEDSAVMFDLIRYGVKQA